MTDATAPPAAPPPRPRSSALPRRALARTLAATVVTLVLIEIGFRIAGPAVLPEPDEWPSELIAAQIRGIDREVSEGRTGGVVLAGSSQTRRLDPQPFIDAGVAYAAFNASVNGGTLAIQRWWLPEVVLPRLRPSTVVLGMSALDVDSDPVPMELRFPQARATATGTLAELDRWAAAHSEAMRLRPTIRGPRAALTSLLGAPPAEELRTGDRGMFAGHDSLVPTKIQQEQRSLAAGFELAPSRFDALSELAELLRAEDVELVVALLPSAPAWINGLPNGAATLREAEDAIVAAADDLGLLLVDVRGVADDDLDFNDAMHLRPGRARAAAELVAEALGGTLPTPAPPAAIHHIDTDERGGVQRIAAVRPGVLEVTLDERSDPTLTDVVVLGLHGGQQLRIRVLLVPSSTAPDALDAAVATLEELRGGTWIARRSVAIEAIDRRRFTIELPSAVRATLPSVLAGSWNAAGTRGAPPPGGRVEVRIPHVLLDDLLGVGRSRTPPHGWRSSEPIAPVKLPPGSDVELDGDRAQWTIAPVEPPAAGGTTATADALVIRRTADLDAAPLVLVLDRERGVLLADGRPIAPASWRVDGDGAALGLHLGDLADELNLGRSGWTLAPRRTWRLGDGTEVTVTGVGLLVGSSTG